MTNKIVVDDAWMAELFILPPMMVVRYIAGKIFYEFREANLVFYASVIIVVGSIWLYYCVSRRSTALFISYILVFVGRE